MIQPHGCQADDGKLVSFNGELSMSLPECPYYNGWLTHFSTPKCPRQELEHPEVVEVRHILVHCALLNTQVRPFFFFFNEERAEVRATETHFRE